MRHDALARPVETVTSCGHDIEQVHVPAGTFLMGDAHGDGRPGDGEGPVRDVTLAGYDIDATTVTVADFARFVVATGHLTDAERLGSSAVFHRELAHGGVRDVLGSPAGAPWWLAVAHADWRRPGGRGSGTEGREDHPVGHVSHADARAYCTWSGRALPTEAQWERAARGGLGGARYPWGDVLRPAADGAGAGEWRCNVWQGRFPDVNTADDGWAGTAPVRTYRPNAWGLWQVVGNVWEWCADRSTTDPDQRGGPVDPAGPPTGEARVVRGGSYLCHDSYCRRYRVAARSAATPDSSTGNTGFRTVAPLTGG